MTDYTKLMFGEHAIHVPAWMVVQDGGNGLVSFIGASRVESGAHPLRFDSDAVHQLVRGELIVRPHEVIASDAAIGMGLEGLIRDPFLIADNGKRII